MLQRNPRFLCIFHALQMSLFPMAILTVFYRRNLGISMAEIMLVQGGFGLVMALFEFPSGYLADWIGYRRTLVIAAILDTVGWSLYARADGIGGVIIGEAFRGTFLVIGQMIGFAIDGYGQHFVLLTVGAVMVTVCLAAMTSVRRQGGFEANQVAPHPSGAAG